MTSYLLLEVVFELRSPGGVAAPEQHDRAATDPAGTMNAATSVHVQVPLARTPDDEIYVPASSLAGAFRAHLGHNAVQIMGPEPTSEDIAASALWFLGTRVDQNPKTVLRTRTAVDRRRASAATTTLRSTEYLEVGSRITAYLKLDDTSLEEDLVESIRTWRPVIGGGRSTGHGIAQVVELRRRLIDLDTPEGLSAWLNESGPEMFGRDRNEPFELPGTPAEPPWRSWTWEIVDGLHIGSGTKEQQVDDEREQTTKRAQIIRDHKGRPYVSGTTWKGILRSRCEFILRSLNVPTCAPNDNPPCGACLICEAFGHSGAGDEAPGRRGQLVFCDSPVENAKTSDRRHVALDRVFGGAHAGQLYSQETVTDGTVTLDVIAENQEVTPAVSALLTLACLDIHDGYVGIGGSTTRGLGTLRLIGDPAQHAAKRDQAITTLTTCLSQQGSTQPQEVR